MSGIRNMDISFGGVVSYRARVCQEHGRNPDVEELLDYNQQAKEAHCPHARRQKHIQDDDYQSSSWTCRDCTARVQAPKNGEPGTFSFHGFYP
jgi:hypothetical protein